MAKSVTLTLRDDVYKTLHEIAHEQKRTVPNLIETLALAKLGEEMFTDAFETEEIASNDVLLKRLKVGHKQRVMGKGCFIE